MRALRVFIGSCAAVLAAAPAALAACPGEDLRPDAGNLARVQAAVVCLHNEERRATGVAPLRPHALLDASAAAHSRDMVARGYFAHDTPDGVDPFERMERGGYLGGGWVWNAGENIAWATAALATPRSVMDAWLESRAHRLTLLASEFSRVGVGIALGAPAGGLRAGAVTYTVDFGWRKRDLQGKRRRL